MIFIFSGRFYRKFWSQCKLDGLFVFSLAYCMVNQKRVFPIFIEVNSDHLLDLYVFVEKRTVSNICGWIFESKVVCTSI